MDAITDMFENLVISYKCKTENGNNTSLYKFENLVISYKCKTRPKPFRNMFKFENLVISYKCKTCVDQDDIYAQV